MKDPSLLDVSTQGNVTGAGSLAPGCDHWGRAWGWAATNCSLGWVIIPLQSLQTAECLVCRPRPELHRWPGAGVTKRPPFRYSLQPGLDIITLAQTRLPASTFHETFWHTHWLSQPRSVSRKNKESSQHFRILCKLHSPSPVVDLVHLEPPLPPGAELVFSNPLVVHQVHLFPEILLWLLHVARPEIQKVNNEHRIRDFGIILSKIIAPKIIIIRTSSLSWLHLHDICFHV